MLEAGEHHEDADFHGTELSGMECLYAAGPGASADGQASIAEGSGLGGGTVVNYATCFRTPDYERGVRALGWHVDAKPRNVRGCDQGIECGRRGSAAESGPSSRRSAAEGDTRGRHDVRATNVVVADASSFPTAPGANSMVTVEAIAYSHARRLSGRLSH